ncbi:hypothetical protein ABTX81_26420 [Kitasatospora sp. NPDC097605]|uniref:hypothetical protein n=1 Tax=Kitasatospora sp. NPDC097605 TaxID=3157226 RepID=UPI003323BF60
MRARLLTAYADELVGEDDPTVVAAAREALGLATGPRLRAAALLILARDSGREEDARELVEIGAARGPARSHRDPLTGGAAVRSAHRGPAPAPTFSRRSPAPLSSQVTAYPIAFGPLSSGAVRQGKRQISSGRFTYPPLWSARML